MKDPIFSLANISNETVVLKINCDTPLQAAKYPYVDTTYEYLSITRGKDHIFSVINKQGECIKTFEDYSDHRAILGNKTELLKTKALAFLKNNHILINYAGERMTKASILYNPRFGKWTLVMEDPACNKVLYLSETAKSETDVMNECKCFVKTRNWIKSKVQGIDIWEAETPKFTIVDTEKKALAATEN